MSNDRLRSLKEVAEFVNRPPHRVIHLCESGVVQPAVDAAGRGSVRRFRRDEVFRIRLALTLQEAGLQVPEILPVMGTLDQLLVSPAVQALRSDKHPFDLLFIVGEMGSKRSPMLACLLPPDGVVLVAPLLKRWSKEALPVGLQTTFGLDVPRGHEVAIIANLTKISAGL